MDFHIYSQAGDYLCRAGAESIPEALTNYAEGGGDVEVENKGIYIVVPDGVEHSISPLEFQTHDGHSTVVRLKKVNKKWTVEEVTEDELGEVA